MTFKNKAFNEVMRELEGIYAKKEPARPRQSEEIVKTAAITIGPNVKPTNSLLLDLCKLAGGLRHRGFTHYADELETKIADYKKAETLYNLHQDTMEDLSQYAHRDGDVEISESANGFGVVETVQSAAKKIREIAEKDPKVKIASRIIKSAQEEDATPQQVIERQVGYYNQVKNTLPFEPNKIRFEAVADADWQKPQIQRLYAKYAKVNVNEIRNYFRIKANLTPLLENGKISEARFTYGRGELSPFKASLALLYPEIQALFQADGGMSYQNRVKAYQGVSSSWNALVQRLWAVLPGATVAFQHAVITMMNQIKAVGTIDTKFVDSYLVDTKAAASIIDPVRVNAASIKEKEWYKATQKDVYDYNNEDGIKLDAWVAKIEAAINTILNTAIGTPVADTRFASAITSLQRSAKIYQDMTRDESLDRDQRVTSNNNQMMAMKMIKLLSKYKGLQEPVILNAVNSTFGEKYTTMSELYDDIDSFNNMANAEKSAGSK